MIDLTKFDGATRGKWTVKRDTEYDGAVVLSVVEGDGAGSCVPIAYIYPTRGARNDKALADLVCSAPDLVQELAMVRGMLSDLCEVLEDLGIGHRKIGDN